jgi:hypothetical protein
MTIRRYALFAAVIASIVSLSGPALAFCGVIEASASGYSEADALSRANNKGLVEVRKLESSYGAGNVHYNPASSHCREGGRGVTCAITQRFCADGARSNPAPWNNPNCRGWKHRCEDGDNRACAKYESNCQND